MIELVLDQTCAEPKYLQIARALREAVCDGRLRSGDHLPPEADLAGTLHVTAYTVSRSYGELARQGVLVQQRGVGTRVTPDAPALLGSPRICALRRLTFVTGIEDMGVLRRPENSPSLSMLAGVTEAVRDRSVDLRLAPGVPQALPKGPEDGEAVLMHSSCVPFLSTPDIDRLMELRRKRVPVAVLGQPCPWPGMPNVYCKRYDAARLACGHLIACGYRSIGFIGDVDSSVYGARTKFLGYIEALHAAGLEICTRHVVASGAVPGETHKAAAALVRNRPLPEAIFVDTDYKAMEVIMAFRASGLSVPEDIGVIGYDGVPEGLEFDPPLTTVAIPRKEAGRRAVEMLMDWPRDGSLPPDIVLQPELRVGGSTRSKATGG